MAKTFSCGDLKNKTFSISSTVDSRGKSVIALSSRGKKDSGDTYKIKPGARILKIESKEDLVKYMKKYSDGKSDYTKMDDVKASETINSILDNMKGTYDGLTIKDDVLQSLEKSEKAIFGENSVRILNDEVLANISNNEENTSIRSGFKADATELSNEAKDLFKDLYKEKDDLNKLIASYPDFKLTALDVSEMSKINNSIYNLNSDNIQIGLRGDSGVEGSNNITLTIEDCVKSKYMCTDYLGKEVSYEDVVSSLALYHNSLAQLDKERYENSRESVYESVENGIKEALKIKQNEYDSDKSIVGIKFAGGCVTMHSEAADKFQKDIYSSVRDYSKESIHIEKRAWDKALSNATDEQKEILSVMAKVKFAPYQQHHIVNATNKGELSSYHSIGDMNIHVTRPDDAVSAPTRMTLDEFKTHIDSNNKKDTENEASYASGMFVAANVFNAFECFKGVMKKGIKLTMSLDIQIRE